jgi:transcriptional regulator with XRE-family HTH domain
MEAHRREDPRLGDLVRRAREQRGLTIEQLAAEAGIPSSHAAAIEFGTFDDMPVGMYRRAEMRAIAEALGVNPELAVEELRRVVEAQSSSISAGALAARESSARVAPDVTPHGPSRAGTPLRPVFALVAPVRRFATVRLHPSQRLRGIAIAALVAIAILAEQQAPPRANPASNPTGLGASEVFTRATENAVAAAQQVIPALPTEIEARTPAMATPAARKFVIGPERGLFDSEFSRPARSNEGVLVIATQPRGARVTVNGIGRGTTPLTIRGLPLGRVRVRVSKERYVSQERDVYLGWEQPATTLRLVLRSVPGQTVARSGTAVLIVSTKPAGARVTVNGIGWGLTPVAIHHLPVGSQRIRVVKDQYFSEERVVHVAAARTSTVHIPLRSR